MEGPDNQSSDNRRPNRNSGVAALTRATPPWVVMITKLILRIYTVSGTWEEKIGAYLSHQG